MIKTYWYKAVPLKMYSAICPFRTKSVWLTSLVVHILKIAIRTML